MQCELLLQRIQMAAQLGRVFIYRVCVCVCGKDLCEVLRNCFERREHEVYDTCAGAQIDK